jgi:CheY-like chemotaxis protein
MCKGLTFSSGYDVFELEMEFESRRVSSSSQKEDPTILVVEDNAFLRYTLSVWLRHHGYTVLEASSADEALVVLESALAVDLVISDIDMPGTLDGKDLALRIQGQFPAIPVILVSGEPRGSLHEAGVSVFFLKPYDLDGVTAAIDKLLRRADRIEP